MRELFAADQERFKKFSLEYADILYDFSKNRITEKTLDLLVALARREHLHRPLEREIPLLEDLYHLGADGTDANETY